MPSVFTTYSEHDGPFDPGELFRTHSTDFLLNTGQLGLPGLSWTEKKTVATISTLAHLFSPAVTERS
jgi:hypothetical protein